MENQLKEITEQVKGLPEQLEKSVKASEKSITENVNAQIKEVKDSITTTDDNLGKVKSEIETLKEQVKEAKASKGTSGTATGGQVKSMGDLFVEAFKEISEKHNLKELKKNERHELEVKAAATMTTANIDAVGTDSVAYNLVGAEPGLTRIQRRNPFLLQLVNVGGTNKSIVQWAEQANADPGAAGSTAEGAAKTQTDFDVVEKSQKVEKVTAYIKVSQEMLDDVEFMSAEIRNELVELVQLKLDQQILAGNGTSPQMKGIKEFATAFAAGSFALAINGANEFDVLRVAIQQVEAANFTPNYIVMHPTDVAALDLQKGTDGHYIMPPFTSANGNVIKGLPIVANTGVTAGEFLVGDFTKSNVRIRSGVKVSVGYENDDFTKNLVTILAEVRAVHYVKTNHAAAIVKGVFTTAKAALETA